MERANKKLIAVVGATGTAVARTLQAGNQRTPARPHCNRNERKSILAGADRLNLRSCS
jgi:hypothetical protein